MDKTQNTTRDYDKRDRTRDRGGWKEERKASRTAKKIRGGAWATKGKARHAGKFAK